MCGQTGPAGTARIELLADRTDLVDVVAGMRWLEWATHPNRLIALLGMIVRPDRGGTGLGLLAHLEKWLTEPL